jgi:hypothetical protein
MRVFRTIVEISMLPVFHRRHELSLGRFVAVQRIGDEHPWGIRQPREQLTEECLCGVLVAPAQHQDVEDVAILIDCPLDVIAVS